MASQDFHDPVRARELLTDMFLSYVQTEDFGNLTTEERKEAVECVTEMRNCLISDLRVKTE